MGTPAAVVGDRITGTCVGHLVPAPMGATAPAPPLPFTAPVLQGTAPSVLIQGRPAVVVGSAGVNSLSPHAGLHPSDPFMTPVQQRGTVAAGSTTVLIEGRGAASTGARCQLCLAPVGLLQGSVTTVLLGGGPGG
ncbi:PAAR domain-containing protein [Serinicoccus sediminis]|uniref:PAAR domain-containing protein n=1 Tax=Serinicoccus sediminis TaxID=2306021 RepID=UPI00101FE31E|nr:PAAR domain-containing protein [Serinicoccus sediminis]